MNLLDSTLILTALIFYGGGAFYSFYNNLDYLFVYYSGFLTIFSSIYHYYNEKKYFEEDFVCCFFMKLHLVSNYVWFLDSYRFWFYTFLSEGLGYFIFYISYKSWNFPNKLMYYISHNIWHMYTGALMWYVVATEPRTDIGWINELFMLLFVIALTNHTLKDKLLCSRFICSTVYLWKLSNFYNLIYLGMIHIVIYYGKIYEKLFQ